MARDVMLALLLVVVVWVLMSSWCWRRRARLKTSIGVVCHARAQCIHPYPGLVHLEQVPNQLTEINSLLGGEVECQLATVPLVLGVNNLHGKSLLSDLSLTHDHGFNLVLVLAHQLSYLR